MDRYMFATVEDARISCNAGPDKLLDAWWTLVVYQRRLNPIHHVRKIVALSETYGTEATARALDDAFEYGAFSSDYITNLLETRARTPPEPAALHLTRRCDLLELELPKPDLSLYDLPGDPTDDTP